MFTEEPLVNSENLWLQPKQNKTADIDASRFAGTAMGTCGAREADGTSIDTYRGTFIGLQQTDDDVSW